MSTRGWVASAMLSPKLRISVFHGTFAVSSHLRQQYSGQRSRSSVGCHYYPRRWSLHCGAAFGGLQNLAKVLRRRRDVPFSESFVCHLQKSGYAFATASQDCGDVWTEEIGENSQFSTRTADLQVVLVSPQIPGNTGCIARSCAAAAVGLHLVEPLGFDIDSAKLRRAGLDYWPYVVVKVHKSWVEFFEYFQHQEGEKRLLGFSKKGTVSHTAVKYQPGDWLVFGSETEGLPADAIEQCMGKKHGGGLVRIPIDETYVRCLNLSVAAGIGVYEALRQLGYRENMLVSPSTDSLVSPFREDIFC